jgi:hypothetical protein
LGLALEEPEEEDTRFELDGLPFAIPPDVRYILRYYDDAVLDHDPSWGGGRFYVRYGRKAGTGTCGVR